MRDLRELDGLRLDVADRFGWNGDSTCGCFVLASPTDGGELRVIASSEGGWDHVSVSRATRCPNWPEMEHVKRLFFRDDEAAMQLHVPVSEHINVHPYCLHIWRPNDGTPIPQPPPEFVAPTRAGGG